MSSSDSEDVLPVSVTDDRPRGGVNVDANERLVVGWICSGDPVKLLLPTAESIAALPDTEKTLPFRGRNVSEVSEILTGLRKTLLSETSPNETFLGNSNNREGQDLIAVSSSKSIELKIGYFVTDAAIGAESASLLLPSDLTSGLFDKALREERKEMIRNGDPDSAVKSFRAQLQNCLDLFGDQELTEKNQLLLNCFFSGMKRTEMLRTLSENPDPRNYPPSSPYLIITAKKPKRGSSSNICSWGVSEPPPLKLDRTWSLSTRMGRNSRVEVLCSGSDGATLRFMLNQKNSSKILLPNGEIFKARYLHGTGYLSFNVWQKAGS